MGQTPKTDQIIDTLFEGSFVMPCAVCSLRVNSRFLCPSLLHSFIFFRFFGLLCSETTIPVSGPRDSLSMDLDIFCVDIVDESSFLMPTLSPLWGDWAWGAKQISSWNIATFYKMFKIINFVTWTKLEEFPRWGRGVDGRDIPANWICCNDALSAAEPQIGQFGRMGFERMDAPLVWPLTDWGEAVLRSWYQQRQTA